MMGSTLRFLGIVAGALSVVSLTRLALRAGLGPTALLMFEFYENLMRAAFGWAEPTIRELLSSIRVYLPWELQLYPHWKHTFVLIGIYFFREALTLYRGGFAARAMFLGSYGFIVAVVTSVAAGTIDPTHGDVSAHFLIACIPILGVLAYDLGDGFVSATLFRNRIAQELNHTPETWSHYFNERLFNASRRALLGLILLVAALQVPLVRQLPSPGLVILGLLIVVLALDRLRVGAVNANDIRTDEEAWLSAFWRAGNTKLGLTMLGVFAGAALFFLFNAGLGPYGY